MVTGAMKLIENGRQWLPPEITTEIGHVLGQGDAQSLLPIQSNKAGWLSFGPNIQLPAGTYRAQIRYASTSEPLLQVGNWDVTIDNVTVMHSGQLLGTNGQIHSIIADFVINDTQARRPIEVRTYFLANGDLQLKSMSIQKLH